MATPGAVSESTPIHRRDFGANPFTELRKVCDEEAVRDLLKTPEQLLADIHEESLSHRGDGAETISRSIARLASLSLRQTRETERQNTITIRLAKIAGLIALVALFLSGVQAYSAWQSIKLNNTKANATNTSSSDGENKPAH